MIPSILQSSGGEGQETAGGGLKTSWFPSDPTPHDICPTWAFHKLFMGLMGKRQQKGAWQWKYIAEGTGLSTPLHYLSHLQCTQWRSFLLRHRGTESRWGCGACPGGMARHPQGCGTHLGVWCASRGRGTCPGGVTHRLGGMAPSVYVEADVMAPHCDRAAGSGAPPPAPLPPPVNALTPQSYSKMCSFTQVYRKACKKERKRICFN